jgi:putative glycosyltransferase (TIGR04372 family)
MALYSRCEFAITSKTGAELFATLADIPVLGLNYTELVSMQPAKKMRFCPKPLKDIETGQLLSWKQTIEWVNFFDIGQTNYGRPIEYLDQEEEDLLAALEDFLPLVSLPEEKWIQYTPLQKEFKATLTRFHLDLFVTRGVPSDSYLRKTGLGVQL